MADSTFITPQLEEEIALAFKERRSVGVILEEHNFESSEESQLALIHVLLKHIGKRMTLELVFSGNEAIWVETRKTVTPSAWETIAKEAEFKAANYLLLGESLFHIGQEDAGTEFIESAVEIAEEKDYAEIAYVVSRVVKDKAWAKDILLIGEPDAKTADDYSTLAESLVKLTDDTEEGTKLFKQALELANSQQECIGIATAVAKSLKDKSWATEIYAQKDSYDSTNELLESIASEEYEESIAAL